MWTQVALVAINGMIHCVKLMVLVKVFYYKPTTSKITAELQSVKVKGRNGSSGVTVSIAADCELNC